VFQSGGGGSVRECGQGMQDMMRDGGLKKIIMTSSRLAPADGAVSGKVCE
jgi:hypothetical protein